MAFVILLIISCFAIFYRCRVKVFAKFNVHPFDVDECEKENMAFDAFVSCALPDKALAQEIVDRLENGNVQEGDRGGYRVCYHERDFYPGTLILRNIRRSIEHSKRVICLLSGDFLKSGFCMLEFHEAWHWNLQRKKHRLIVVKCPGVDEALAAAERGAVPGVEDETMAAANREAVVRVEDDALTAGERGAVPGVEDEAMAAANREAVVRVEDEALTAGERGAVPGVEEEAMAAANREAVHGVEDEALPAAERGAVPHVEDEALAAAKRDAIDRVEDVRIFLRNYTYIEHGSDDWWQRLLYAMPINRLPAVDRRCCQRFLSGDQEALLQDVQDV